MESINQWVAVIGGILTLAGTIFGYVWTVAQKTTTVDNKVMELTTQISDVKSEVKSLRALVESWKNENSQRFSVIDKVLTKVETTIDFIREEMKNK